ncbi:MAG TPA: tail fiber protein [Burkholderiaceae bacterium]
MSEPYVGEIRLFAGNFAPLGWAFCDGQLLSIAQNTVLFALIGTTYGGDGQSTYALPDLRGRVPVHQGKGYVAGESGGQETVALAAAQMPAHRHAMNASTAAASITQGPSQVLGSSAAMHLYGSGTPVMAMDPNALAQAGGNQAHDNMPPFVGLNYIISLFGIFPSQI